MPATHHRQNHQRVRGKVEVLAPMILVHHVLHLTEVAHRVQEPIEYLLSD
jgi:hypothetical protein